METAERIYRRPSNLQTVTSLLMSKGHKIYVWVHPHPRPPPHTQRRLYTLLMDTSYDKDSKGGD